MKRRLATRIILISLVVLVVSFSLNRFFDIDLEKLRSLVTSFGIFAPIAYTFILFLGLSVPFNPVPDLLTVNLAVLLFRPITAVTFTFFAHCLALVVNYWVARRFGEKILKRVAGDVETAYIEKLAKRINLRLIFGLRFVLPTANLLGFDVVSYVAGLEKVSFVKFFILSIIPWTLLNVIFFFGTFYIKEISIALYFVPFLLLVVIPSLIFLWHNKRAKIV